MKLVKLLCLLSFVFVFSQANAQDIHFSQFNLSPMTLNPANAGAFKGTFRLGGIYRDQWGSVIENQFRTPSFYVDVPAFRGIGKKDWVGIGVSLLNDQSGTANLRNLTISGALAYHLALDPQRKNVLTIAGQVGQVQKRFDQTALRFENQYENGGFNAGLPTGENNLQDNVSYLDYGAGVSFRSKPSANFSWNLGASVFHLAEPDEGFLDATAVVPRRIVAHAGARIGLNEQWLLQPLLFYQTQAGASEFIAQALFGYKLGENKDFLLNMGLGYRLSDAAIAIVGLEYKNLVVGVSYDINVSELGTFSGNQGGFEIGLGYIVRIPKDPTIPPVIFNPRF